MSTGHLLAGDAAPLQAGASGPPAGCHRSRGDRRQTHLTSPECPPAAQTTKTGGRAADLPGSITMLPASAEPTAR